MYSDQDLEYFKTLLVEKKENLQENIRRQMLGNDNNNDKWLADAIDVASALTLERLQLKLLDRDRKLLKSIDNALKKIEDGLYGYCEGTGEIIPRKRLEARPWCSYSVQYKEMLERRAKVCKVNGITCYDNENFDD